MAGTPAADGHAGFVPKLTTLDDTNGGQIAQVTYISLLHCVGLEQGHGGYLSSSGQPLSRLDNEVLGSVERGASGVEIGRGFGHKPKYNSR
jgi:hypothetical protein